MRARHRLIVGAVAILIALFVIASRKKPASDRPAPIVINPAKGTFAGRVTDTRGAIVRATIEVVWIGERSLPRTIASVATESDGTYAIPSKRPAGERGTMLLSAKADGFALAGRAVDGEIARQDFVLVREQTSATIRVVDKNDAPVPGAEVVLSFEPFAAERGALVIAHGTSDDAGELTVRTLSAAAGTYHWSATKKGHGAAHGEVEKRAGEAPTDIVARLDSGVRIVGQIVDVQGKPASGASIRLLEAAGTWEDGTSAGADGRFTIAGAPHGELALEVFGEWVLAGGRSEVTYVDVPKDIDEKSVKLVVEPGGVIRGMVVRSDRTPVPAVDIVATSAQGTPKNVATRADGSFELRGLRAGIEWEVTARADGLAPAFAEHVRTGASLELVLRAGGALVGRVVDDGGNGSRDVEVYAHRFEKKGADAVGLREYAFAKTEADGTYRLDHLGEGTYRVEVRPAVRMRWSGPATKVFEASVSEGNETRLADVTAKRPGQIKGQIRTAAGVLPRSVEVSILRQSDHGTPHRVNVECAKDGSFIVPNIEAGTFTVDVHDAERGHATVEAVSVAPGGTGSATFIFDARNELAGTVTDGSGKPLADATVDVYVNDVTQAKHLLPGRRSDNLTGNIARTDATGHFVVHGLPNGRYRVRVAKEGAPPLISDVTIPSTALALSLPRASTIEVQVKQADRVVIAETRDGAGYSAQAVTNGRGVARFDALPPGRYRVRAVIDGAPEAQIALAAGETRITTLGQREVPGVMQ